MYNICTVSMVTWFIWYSTQSWNSKLGIHDQLKLILNYTRTNIDYVLYEPAQNIASTLTTGLLNHTKLHLTQIQDYQPLSKKKILKIPVSITVLSNILCQQIFQTESGILWNFLMSNQNFHH